MKSDQDVDSTVDSPTNGVSGLRHLPLNLSQVPPAGSLSEVLSGHIRLAHLPSLVSTEYCESLMQALIGLQYTAYEISALGPDAPKMLKFGPTVLDQYLGAERPSFDSFAASYFDVASEADHDLRRRFADSELADPLDIILALLRYLWDGPVEIASEGDRQYFAGVVRSLPGGAPPHTDNARRAPDLSISRTVAQGSILLYLQMPVAGGGVKVFDKRSNPLEAHGELGYEHVSGVRFSGVTPRAGDVVLFPTTFFHAVEPVVGDGERVTISSFFGEMPDGRIVLWS